MPSTIPTTGGMSFVRYSRAYRSLSTSTTATSSFAVIAAFMTFMESVAHGTNEATRSSLAECVPISDVIDRWVVRRDGSRFSEVELDESGFGFDDKHHGAWCAKG